MRSSTAPVAILATLSAVLILYFVGRQERIEDSLSITEDPERDVSNPEEVRGSSNRDYLVERESGEMLREEVATEGGADESSEPWLRVVPDIDLHGLSTHSALEYYWGERLPEIMEYLGIHDERYLAQGFPEGRRLGDLGEYLEQAKVHLLSKLSAPLASCDTLAPGLQVPAYPLNLLLLDPKIGLYEFLLSGRPELDDECLASAEVVFTELRRQHFDLRLELQARIVEVVSRDLRELSVTKPPKLGSIFISPATSKVSPEYVQLFSELPERRRRWSLSKSFWAHGMNTYYSGMYAIQLDLDPVLSGFIDDFEAQEAHILSGLQELKSSY